MVVKTDHLNQITLLVALVLQLILYYLFESVDDELFDKRR